MKNTENTNDSTVPMVSVLLPIRNEGRFIERSLQAVLAQDYPADRIEIIVADGMSTDETRDIVHSFSRRYPNVRLIDNPGKIVPKGLNAAIAQAQGEILVRVDGHCEIAADYVRRCVHHLCNDDVAGVGGPLETIGETLTARAIATAMSSPFGVGNSAFRTTKGQDMFADTVAFPAYWRRVVAQAGPFDEELVRNQDDEYNYRLRKMGARILLASDVRARYYSRSSLRSLWRQYYQYGYWKVRVMQKHIRQMCLRQFAPPVFAAGLIVLSLGAIFSTTAAVLLALQAGCYLAVNLTAASLTAARTEWRMMPLLVVAFAALHLSFGFGFLVGLVKFLPRWGDQSTRVSDYAPARTL